MIFKSVDSKEIWEAKIGEFETASIYQSWNWGEVIIERGGRINRFEIIGDNEELLGLCQIEIVDAKRGKFLNLHHGPILREWNKEIIADFTKELTKIAKQEKAWFVRLSPKLEYSENLNSNLLQHGYKLKIGENMQGVKTLYIDLNKSEEELLQGFSKSTRYNINKSIRDGVEIRTFYKPDDVVSELAKICYQTSQKKNFKIEYDLEKIYKKLSADGQAVFIGAYYNDKLIASGLYINYSSEAHSFYRGSIKDVNAKYAPYLVQWEGIKIAKQKGFKSFNLWGITDSEDPKHPWYGFSQFKKGFSDNLAILMPVYDLKINNFYYLTRSFEYLESKKSH